MDPKLAAWRDFFARQRWKGESLDDYAEALRVLSEPCDFGLTREVIVKYRFLSGISDQSLKNLRLLHQAGCWETENKFASPSSSRPNGSLQTDSGSEASFKKTSGASDGAGEEFEQQILTLIYLRLLHSGSEFYIGSNMAAAGKFDDIVVKYRADSQHHWNTALLQLKKKKKTDIADSELLALNGDFGLVKYGDSYFTLQSSTEKDMEFLGEFSGHQFIIFTNTRFPDKLTTKGDINSLFDTGGEAVFFAPDSQVYEQLCEWVDLKLKVSQLNGQIQGISKDFVTSKIKEVFSESSNFKNKAVKSTIDSLLKNPTSNAIAKALQSLQPVCDNKESYLEFLGNLRLYTGQANEERLDRIIRRCVADTLKLTDRLESDRLAHELGDKVKAWWKKSNKYLTQHSRIWLDLVTSHINKLSTKKLVERSEYNIQFTDAAIDVLYREIPWTNGGILNVIVDSRTTASSMKVVAALARFGDKGNILHVDVATLLSQEDEIVGAWSSRWCRALVVECDTELGPTDAARLSDKIIKVAEGDVADKVFVIIGRQGHGLTDTLDNFKCHRDICKWDDLTPPSQESLLGLEIELQGSTSTLHALVGGDGSFLDRVNGDVLSQLLRGDTRCGKMLEPADDIFVPRRLRTFDGDPVTGKVVLLVAGPGMGKSTLIKHNALSAKTADPTTWVVNLKLNDCTHHLATMQVEGFNGNAARKMLEKMSLDSCNSLEIALFRSFGRDLVVAVDGVDEVCPHYEKQVLTFLRHLARLELKQLWVSSRPTMLLKLESLLEVRACTLEPFSKDDQSTFFLRAWQVLFPEGSLYKLQIYTRRMMEVLRAGLGNSEPIWEVPLMASMVADVFEQNIRSYLAGEKHEMDIKLDTMSLYNTFIQKKCDLYYTEKKKTDGRTRQLAAHIDDEESLKQTFHRNHRLAAMKFLFTPHQISTLKFQGSAEFDTNLAEFLEHVRSGRETRGIIDNVSENGTPNFVHRTFAEFLVASWLSENFLDNKEFVEWITFNPTFAWTSDIFNRILARHHPLHSAVLNGDGQEVARLLPKEIADCESKDAGGRTPVHLSVLLGDTERNLDILQLLLERGARVDVADRVLSWRPLQYADKTHAWTVAGVILSYGGNEDDMASISSIEQPTKRAFIEFMELTPTAAPDVSLMLATAKDAGLHVVRFLVEERRGDVHCHGSQGETMLHMAAQGGDVALLEYLCDKGLSVHAEDSDHATPLHYAGRQGNTDAVGLLAERGADLDAVDGRGETCLQTATRLGEYEVMTLLVNKGAEFDVCVDEETGEEHLNVALLCATFAGSVESVRRLIARGASITFQDAKGRTAPVIAATKGFLDVVELLVKHETSTNGHKDGDVHIHAAARQGCVTVASFLIQHVGDINVVNHTGMTAMMIACYHGHLDVVKLLVENGASSLVPDKDGDLPIHAASRQGHVEVVTFLLQQDEDVNLVNIFGRTALAMASENDHLSVVRLLAKNGASATVADKYGNTPLYYAAQNGHLEVVFFLVQHVDDVHVANHVGKTALTQASEKGHLTIVKLLVENGAGASMADKHGNTPLYYAAKQGHVEVVSFLVQQAKNVNVMNIFGKTALAKASENGHLDVIKLLVKNGARTSVADIYGNTPLYYAAQNGHFEVVFFLVQHVEDVSVTNHVGKTALTQASEKGHLKIAKQLVWNGASTSVADKHGNTPLHYAAQQGHEEVVSFLAQQVKDVNVANFAGKTALSQASERGHLHVVKVLVKNGASTMVADKNDILPFHYAAHQGHVEVVSFLVQHVEDINVVNRNGKTALNLASYNGYLDVVELLEEYGASSLVADKDDILPFHYAAQQGHVEMVSFLVQHVEDINVVNRNGKTALLLASYNNHLDVVKLLVEKGASTLVKDKDGNSPIYYAAQQGHVEVVSYLVPHVEDINVVNHVGVTALSRAAHFGYLDVVKLLVENGASISVSDEDSCSSLHYAVQQNHFNVISYLVEHVEDINEADHAGRTPFSYASYNGHLNVVKLLFESGAAPSVADRSGKTPLYYAAQKGHVEVVFFLVHHIEDINVVNHVGVTSLSRACFCGHLEVVKLLVENGASALIVDRDGNSPLYYAKLQGHVKVAAFLLRHVEGVDALDKKIFSLARSKDHDEVGSKLTEKERCILS